MPYVPISEKKSVRIFVGANTSSYSQFLLGTNGNNETALYDSTCSVMYDSTRLCTVKHEKGNYWKLVAVQFLEEAKHV